MSKPPVVVVRALRKLYGATLALDGVSFEVPPGQFLAVVGPSGSGKSTLLNLIAGLEIPTEGSVQIAGEWLAGLSDDERADLRLRKVGFIFQSFNLFPTFTVLENTAVPLELQGVSPRRARRRAIDVLEQVEIAPGAYQRLPAQLSGGEQQRVAIARALVTEPQLLLADEPTGNLDSTSGQSILELLMLQVAKRRLTVIMVTHNTHAALLGSRIIELRDGRVVNDVAQEPKPSLQVVPIRPEGDSRRKRG